MNYDRKDILVFIIGLLSMIKLRILGTFGVSELIVFISYLFVNPFKAQENSQIRNLMYFAFLWLVGVLLSDLVNNSTLEDSLKGAFNVVFLMALIPFCYWALIDKPSRMLFFWAGVGISSILGFRYQRLGMMNELQADIWLVYALKWSFLFLGGWLYYKGKRTWSYALIIAFGTWTLFHLSRNIFLIFTFTVVLLLYIGKLDDTNIEYKLQRYKQGVIKLFLVLGIAFIGITNVYEKLASDGVLGERAKVKYERQKNSEIGLASGRADFLASLYAISKKPVFGYGSYAKDKNHLYDRFNKMIGMPSSPGAKSSALKHVPGHSYMLGAWVYAGILGFVFWLFILKTIFSFLRQHLFEDPQLLCMNLMLTFSMLWDIFFSPFSDRLNFVMYIVLIIIFNSQQYEAKLTSIDNA